MSDLKQKLQEMAELSILANRISEIQEKNLKMFPFVFFDGVQMVKIDYDLGHAISEESKEVHHKSFVGYHIMMGVGDDPSAARLEMLEKAVRQLFWNDIRVEIHINGKKAFESKND